jgi:hypothetical protein
MRSRFQVNSRMGNRHTHTTHTHTHTHTTHSHTHTHRPQLPDCVCLIHLSSRVPFLGFLNPAILRKKIQLYGAKYCASARAPTCLAGKQGTLSKGATLWCKLYSNRQQTVQSIFLKFGEDSLCPSVSVFFDSVSEFFGPRLR